MNKTVEIFFSDLNQNVQKELLDAEGISSPEEANWDVFPLATLEFYVEEEKGDTV